MKRDTFTQAAESVNTLLVVARAGTGASKPAAQVLLSAYNSYDYAVPVADLALLDGTNYTHAMNVMRLRYHGIEPHQVIQEGAEKFQALTAQWAHLKISSAEAAA